MSEHPHVKLGEHSLPIYQQRWRRVINRLGAVIDVTRLTALRAAAGDQGLSGAAVIEVLSDRLYYVFCTFIPNLPEWMPEHEFAGYATPEAYREDRYDDDLDKSPTFPQFLEAFDLIVEVNGGKRFLDLLGKALDFSQIKMTLSKKIADWIEQTDLTENSTGSQSLPSPSGESVPSDSTPTSPTEDEPATELQSENGQHAITSSGSPQPISA